MVGLERTVGDGVEGDEEVSRANGLKSDGLPVEEMLGDTSLSDGSLEK